MFATRWLTYRYTVGLVRDLCDTIVSFDLLCKMICAKSFEQCIIYNNFYIDKTLPDIILKAVRAVKIHN